MNICVITTFDCSFEEFKAMLGEFEGEMQKCVSEWEIVKLNTSLLDILKIPRVRSASRLTGLRLCGW